MNAARNRQASALVLQLSEVSTDELLRRFGARNPSRPSRYLHPAAYRRAIEHVLMVRQIMADRVQDHA